MINYRLGLKIGDNYIGWCMMGINERNIPIDIIDQGIRVFQNGREPSMKKGLLGDPKAMTRTMVRSMRRQIERSKMRRIITRKQLIKCGLFPEDKTSQKNLELLNPLKLRNDAIALKLEPYEIGRALFHLQQRRGFKSNRKDATKGNANELSGMKLGISNLGKVLEGKYTLGQYLYKRFEKEICTKFRPNLTEKDLPMYAFYASREMVEKEFFAIWDAQQKYHPDLLTEDARRAVHIAIFKQRPLKTPPKGKCLILPNEDRLEWAMPSAQRFRIIKEINNLRFTAPDSMAGQSLDAAQRKKLYNELLIKNHITFKQINKLLGLSSHYEFNLDCNKRERLDGDKVAKLMRDDERFGKEWDTFPLDKQNAIMDALLNSDIDDETLEYEFVNKYRLKDSQAQKILNTAFPDSVVAYGTTIINSILPLMLDNGIQETVAIKELGYDITTEEDNREYNYLPYYGEILQKYVNKTGTSKDPMVEKFGKIANPTTHIILNELRKLMNRLKEKHGKWPSGITIEVDHILRKGSKELLASLKEKEKRNKKYNSWRNEIERYKGSEPTKDDFLKMELWEELAEDPMHRKCVLSGRTINMSMLFTDEIQVGYILPYSKTLDNSKSNLLLMDSQLAYMKGNRTPFEAFCDEDEDYSHNTIISRVMNLPKHKQWRFRADAMETFISKTLDTVKDENNGLDIFAIRPLKDTNYITKLFKKYLRHACSGNEYNIHTTAGGFTPLLRGAWGMNDFLEMRHYDYRRYTIDALVLSLTTPFIIKKISTAALLEETKGIKITKTIGHDKPFSAFDWEKTQTNINKVIVSYRPNIEMLNISKGKGHDDTIYSYKGEKNNDVEIVIRKPLLSIKNKKDIKNVYWKKGSNLLNDFIDEKNIEESLKQFTATKEINNKYNPFYKAKSVQMVYTKPSNIMVAVEHNSNGEIIKIAQGGSNYCAEIFSVEGNWQIEIIKTFDANQKDFIPEWQKIHPTAEFIMKLHCNDMVIYEEEGNIKITKVKKISGNKTVTLVPHNLTKEKEEENMWGASARQLQLKNARKVTVKVDGTLYDPMNISIIKRNIA